MTSRSGRYAGLYCLTLASIIVRDVLFKICVLTIHNTGQSARISERSLHRETQAHSYFCTGYTLWKHRLCREPGLCIQLRICPKICLQSVFNCKARLPIPKICCLDSLDHVCVCVYHKRVGFGISCVVLLYIFVQVCSLGKPPMASRRLYLAPDTNQLDIIASPYRPTTNAPPYRPPIHPVTRSRQLA